MTRTAAILSTAFVVGCFTPTELDDRWADPDEIEFAASLDIDLTQLCTTSQIGCWNRTASGLYWKDLVAGDGMTAAVAGDSVRVHYTGWLPDGTLVDTSRDEDHTPLKFLLGIGFALQGVNEGIVGMRVGGKRMLVIRPNLAYGRRGNPPVVPPLATLVFEVELMWLRRNLALLHLGD